MKSYNWGLIGGLEGRAVFGEETLVKQTFEEEEVTGQGWSVPGRGQHLQRPWDTGEQVVTGELKGKEPEKNRLGEVGGSDLLKDFGSYLKNNGQPPEGILRGERSDGHTAERTKWEGGAVKRQVRGDLPTV